MREHGRLRRALAAAVLMALAGGLAGCSVPGSMASAPPATPTPRPRPPAAVLKSATGTWVFKDAATLEHLRLKQRAAGVVAGNGDAAVKVTTPTKRVDHSAINIHRGYLSKGTLTLSLYVTPTDWGSGETVVEYLTCKATTRVLHCLMSLPLFKNVSNVRQDFYRQV